jgi:hypothetical protein
MQSLFGKLLHGQNKKTSSEFIVSSLSGPLGNRGISVSSATWTLSTQGASERFEEPSPSRSEGANQLNSSVATNGPTSCGGKPGGLYGRQAPA